jgi:hypothetical protein
MRLHYGNFVKKPAFEPDFTLSKCKLALLPEMRRDTFRISLARIRI